MKGAPFFAVLSATLLATRVSSTNTVHDYYNDTDTNKTGFLQWRDQSLRMYDINYRWSPVVFDHRGKEDLDEDGLKARAYVGYPGER